MQDMLCEVIRQLSTMHMNVDSCGQLCHATGNFSAESHHLLGMINTAARSSKVQLATSCLCSPMYASVGKNSPANAHMSPEINIEG